MAICMSSMQRYQGNRVGEFDSSATVPKMETVGNRRNTNYSSLEKNNNNHRPFERIGIVRSQTINRRKRVATRDNILEKRLHACNLMLET